MGNLVIVGDALNLKKEVESLQSLCFQLSQQLMALHDLSSRFCVASKDEEGGWCFTDPEKSRAKLNIFARFSFRLEQDSREVVKLPSVLQLHPQKHQGIIALAHDINERKTYLNDINQHLKAQYGSASSQQWQKAIRYASILQILRKISVIEDDVSYLGLSHMVKPISVRISKKKAMEMLEQNLRFCESNVRFAHQVAYIKQVMGTVAAEPVDTKNIRLGRQGSPRVMLNAKSQSVNYQVMASMPVLVAHERIIDVSLPRHKKRRSRSDKVIPIKNGDSVFSIHVLGA